MKHTLFPFSSKIIILGIILSLSIFPSSSVFAGINTWTSGGPYGGIILALATDPSSPNTVYVGTWGGGVFKSTDSGDHWNPINVGLTDKYIKVIAIDPITPTILYTGTGTQGVYKALTEAGIGL